MGYGVAAVAAVALVVAGAGALWVALMLWLGGACATLALAVAAAALRPAAPVQAVDGAAEATPDEAFAQAAARWEADNSADVAPPPARASA